MESNNKTIDDLIKRMKMNKRKINTTLILKAYKGDEPCEFIII